MKAVILAGGKGTRGRPYTEFFPKAMTPVEGRPLIQHIVTYLRGFRFVGEIIIVADFEGLGGQIRNYLEGQKRLTFVQDSQSGTGGDLLHLRNHLRGESEFALWFADNLCAIDLGEMRRTFRAKKSHACVATRTKRREATGFAEVRDGIVTRFREKPVLDLPLSECLGIYMLGYEVIRRIARMRKKEINLSYDILEGLSGEGRISAYDIGGTPWIDAQSPVSLESSRATVRRIIAQMGR